MSTRMGIIIDANDNGFTLSWEKPRFTVGLIQETNPKKAEEFAKKLEYMEFSICLYLRKMIEDMMNMKNRKFGSQYGATIDAEGTDSGHSNEAGSNGEVGQDRSTVASSDGQPDGDKAGGSAADGNVLGVSD